MPFSTPSPEGPFLYSCLIHPIFRVACRIPNTAKAEIFSPLSYCFQHLWDDAT